MPLSLLLNIYPNAIRFVAIILLATVAGLGVWAGLHFYGAAQYTKGQADAKASMQAEFNRQLQARLDENARIKADYDRDLAAMRGKYESEKALVDKYHADHLADGLRVTASVCADAGFTRPAKTGGTSGGTAAAADTVTLPRDVAENLFALAKQADEETAQCRLMQDFIRKNGFAP